MSSPSTSTRRRSIRGAFARFFGRWTGREVRVRGAAAKLALAELRRDLDRLPETPHPLGH
jgi:hypothetical protein